VEYSTRSFELNHTNHLLQYLPKLILIWLLVLQHIWPDIPSTAFLEWAEEEARFSVEVTGETIINHSLM
jgi:hypothetical protein